MQHLQPTAHKSYLSNIQQIVKYYLIACCLFILSILLVQYHDHHHVLNIKELKFGARPSSVNSEAFNEGSASKDQYNNGITMNLAMNIPSSSKDFSKTTNRKHHVQWNNMHHSKQMPSLTCNSYDSSSHQEPQVQTSVNSSKTQREICDTEYGCVLLNNWKQHSYSLCEEIPSSTFQRLRKYVIGGEERFPTRMKCYSYNNTHVPPATAPHTVCEVSYLVFDFSKMVQAPCLQYRPGYFCKKPTYFNYNESALIGN